MSYRNCRMRAGMRIEDAASLLGVTPHTVQQWEVGERSPRADSIKKMMSVYDVTADDLLSDEKELRRSAVRMADFVRSMRIKTIAERTGIAPETLYGYREFRRVPKWDSIRRICKAFRLDVAYFLEEVPDEVHG